MADRKALKLADYKALVNLNGQALFGSLDDCHQGSGTAVYPQRRAEP